MIQAWKMIAYTQRLGGGKLLKEFYLVAIPDRGAAIEALRIHKDLVDTQIEVVGEASSDFLDWLDVENDDILCVMEGRQDYVPRRYRAIASLDSVSPEKAAASAQGDHVQTSTIGRADNGHGKAVHDLAIGEIPLRPR